MLAVGGIFSGFLDELFLAPGAGDGDFAFAPGDTDHLAAFGAVEVAVLPVLCPRSLSYPCYKAGSLY